MESALTRTYLVTLIVNVICMKVSFQHLCAHMFCISESLMTKTKYLIISQWEIVNRNRRAMIE